MTVWINEEKVFSLIEEKKPRGIVLNAPGGLLKQTRGLMDKIKERYGIPSVLVGDSCFGICDTVDNEVEKLGADMALHIGHNAVVQTVGDYTYLIDAVDDVKFDGVLNTAIPLMKEFHKIGLVTFSQHLNELESAKATLEDAGFEVKIGRKNNLLLGSQIFGCDFSTIHPLRNEVDAFCFLGQSEFHVVGLALATGKPTYMLDPYLQEVTNMEEAAEERRKRAILAVYKALDARTIGVITGLKEGQRMIGRSRWITKRLEMHGRKVLQLAMREITPERLAPYRDVDAFIQTACPRISIDGFTFDRPVLSIPQADALVRLMDGKEIGDFLERPKWIELTVGLLPRRR
ncbi:MAG: diphthamide biosynthesis enzyme Dph2 [Thaumarchaeota archaeon]|nr:diphthamide biosynthesis enzyme Dph2 [Nitrososphaerota archaeon]